MQLKGDIHYLWNFSGKQKVEIKMECLVKDRLVQCSLK